MTWSSLDMQASLEVYILPGLPMLAKVIWSWNGTSPVTAIALKLRSTSFSNESGKRVFGSRARQPRNFVIMQCTSSLVVSITGATLHEMP